MPWNKAVQGCVYDELARVFPAHQRACQSWTRWNARVLSNLEQVCESNDWTTWGNYRRSSYSSPYCWWVGPPAIFNGQQLCRCRCWRPSRLSWDKVGLLGCTNIGRRWCRWSHSRDHLGKAELYLGPSREQWAEEWTIETSWLPLESWAREIKCRRPARTQDAVVWGQGKVNGDEVLERAGSRSAAPARRGA